jgi:DNA gyrase subunit A
LGNCDSPGRIKRQKGLSEISTIRIQDGDELGWSIYSDTRKTVSIFTQLGKAYTLLIAEITATSGYGDPLQALFKFEDGEKVVGVCVNDSALYPKISKDLLPKSETPALSGIDEADEKQSEPPYGIATTRKGMIHRFPLEAFSEVSQKIGRTYFLLEGNDEVVACYGSRGDETVIVASTKGSCMIFDSTEIPLRQRASKGCIGMKVVGEDEVLGFILTENAAQGLWVYTGASREFHIKDTGMAKSQFKKTKRGGKGQAVILR